jgi:hypothetical protein
MISSASQLDGDVVVGHAGQLDLGQVRIVGLGQVGERRPSALARARNRHRCGWPGPKSAVRAILASPATPATRSGTASAPLRELLCELVSKTEPSIRRLNIRCSSGQVTPGEQVLP